MRDRLTISGIMTLSEGDQFDLIGELLDLKARYNLKLEPQDIEPVFNKVIASKKRASDAGKFCVDVDYAEVA